MHCVVMTRTEHSEQAALVSYLRYRYPDLLFSSFPNGFFMPGVSSQRRAVIVNWLKAEGMTPGMPDLFIFSARVDSSGRIWHGCAVEMKREHGGRLSKKQKAVLDMLFRNGYYVVVGHGFDEVVQKISEYLSWDVAVSAAT